MEESAIVKFDTWLDRIKKYLLVFITIVIAVWTVAIAWGNIIELMDKHETLTTTFNQNKKIVKEDLVYGFDRTERIINRKIKTVTNEVSELKLLTNAQSNEINRLETELEEFKIEEAYNKGLWDGRWEILKRNIK